MPLPIRKRQGVLISSFLTRIGACALLVLTWVPVTACFYSTYSFSAEKAERVNLDDLLYDRLNQRDRARGGSQFFVKEAQRLAREYPQKGMNVEFINDYAYAVYMSGNLVEALRLWEEAYALSPSDYRTLCNLATAAHIQGKFDDAITFLQRAVKQRPGFRDGAEELHVRLLEHLKKQRSDPDYITRELFVTELTPAWRNRKDPPNRFQVPNLPKNLKQGLAELLEQFPKSGDTWFVLAMLLEDSGDYHRARLAYQKAFKAGCGQSEALQDYLKKYAAFEESRNPIRRVGWMFLGAVVLTLALVVGSKLWTLLRDVIDDIREARKHSAPPAKK